MCRTEQIFQNLRSVSSERARWRVALLVLTLLLGAAFAPQAQAQSPSNLTARATDTGVVLSWTATGSPVTKYQYQRSTCLSSDYADRVCTLGSGWGTPTDTGTTPPTATTVTLTGLTRGTNYLWRVRAVRGTSTFSAWTADQVRATPGANARVTPPALNINEGESRTYTVRLYGKTPTGTVTVAVAKEAGDAASLTANPASLTFTSSNWNTPKTVTVTAAHDDDAEDAKATFTHTATGGGYGAADIASVPVTAADDETPVTTVPTEPVEITITLTSTALGERGDVVEGESYQITATANFSDHVDTEVTIMRDHGQSDATDDDFTVGPITIAAGKITGTTALMVTADEVAEKGEKLVLYGIANNARTNNALMFTIWDSAVPALPLIGQLLLALFLMARGARLHRRWRD